MLVTMVLLRQIKKVHRAASCFVAIRRIFNPAQIVSSSTLLEAPPFSKAREKHVGIKVLIAARIVTGFYLVDFLFFLYIVLSQTRGPAVALQDGRFMMEVRLKILETKEKEPH